jgi:hypothetical protein
VDLAFASTLNSLVYWGAIASSFLPCASLSACALATIGKRRERVNEGERRAQRALEAAGIDSIHDFLLEREDGSFVQIDHAALFRSGIAVIETKHWRGYFEYPHDGYSGPWLTTTDDGAKIPAFDASNPFTQNRSHCASVRALSGAAAVWNVVMFTHPNCVITMSRPTEQEEAELDDIGRISWYATESRPALWDVDDVSQIAAAMNNLPADPSVPAAWAALKAAARTDRAARSAHRTQVGAEEPGSGRWKASLIMLASGIAAGVIAAGFWAFQFGFDFSELLNL